MKASLRDWLLLGARVLVGGVFLALAPGKIVDPVAFLKAIHEYQAVPEHWPFVLNLAAVVLPWLELLGGAFLILGVLRRGTAAVLAASLFLFSAAILFRGLAIHAEQGISFCAVAFDCGCGTGVVPVCRKLLENSTLLALALVLATARPDRLTLPAFLRRRAR